ncbi:hypothetical protein E5676_scaffold680G00650 [Cucumis melo var. makuwa]|uniref:Uncharacterized protein n=1 Tax=Cucumis melo var. makuwa TaxID=1194695 RepID=A0A5D3BSW3_CUCMM|nr:hypothetical protein E5676_scaffold680G00650 [Cucumis melo var. makuwa]
MWHRSMGELTPPRGDCQPFRLVYTWQEKDGDLQPRGLLIVRVTVTSKSLVFIGFLLSASVTGPIAGCHADSPLGSYRCGESRPNRTRVWLPFWCGA